MSLVNEFFFFFWWGSISYFFLTNTRLMLEIKYSLRTIIVIGKYVVFFIITY
jgi:hypothetical protein